MSVGLMANPKKPKGEPELKGEESRIRSAVLMIRGTPEWKAWVGRLMDFDRAPSLNDLADRAFVAYARQVGFREAAPKR